MPARKKARSEVSGALGQGSTAEVRKLQKTTGAFPIVGIGASAGGVAAFEAFFSGMPGATDPGMAFVIVQHLAPDHKSILSDLIRRHTSMPVFEVEEGMLVRPNCAYIIPPNCDMAILNGTLQLLAPAAPRGQRLPIDFFFRSLAQDQHERAIGIVLSGTGNDGTLGMRAIKGEGGMLMAQSPDSAEFDGMPRSAIATGLVDYVLAPDEMMAQLRVYVAHTLGKSTGPDSAPPLKGEFALKKLFVLLRAKTGHDFSLYKPNTIRRRIERRMAVHQIGTLEDYVKYAQQTPSEVEALFRDFLIGVTNFFRDPEAFKVIEEQVIPALFACTSAAGEIRVWTPGCSTGEEAYSLAMLLAEAQEARKQNVRVQLFATDIDSQAIGVARVGLYPASIATDLSPERLARFFTLEPDGLSYRINKAIREMLIFSEQDVIKDPPFSRLDLISCRNLMIYLGGDLQKKLIPLFHYALRPGGFLFLGTSETVGDFDDLYTVVDRKVKLYQRKEDLHIVRRTALSRFLRPTMLEHPQPRAAGKGGAGKMPLRELTEQALLQQIAPAALVNSQGDILYLHGRTGRYLEPAVGEAGVNNVLKMSREGLRHGLTIALRKAVAGKELVQSAGLRVKTNGEFSTVNLTIRPVVADPASPTEAPLYLIILEEAVAPLPVPGPVADASPTSSGIGGGETSPGLAMGAQVDARITSLLQELQGKEEYLQSTIQELETANQELESSNEEMQSVNEELQATNEELETSKEELQSVNEELATVNEELVTVNNELQAKVAELSRSNNDMNNLLAGTGIGTIFVDHQLNVMRFTPPVTQVINLIATDVGRPVGHIVSNLIDYNRLEEDLETVLDDLVQKEIEVQTKAGAWFLLRIRPYRTLENVIEGAVITFVDFTEMRKLRENLSRLAAVVRDSHDAVTLQDLEGRILAWNPAAEKMYGWSEAEALRMHAGERIPKDLPPEALLAEKSLGGGELEPYRTQRLTKDGRRVEVLLMATALEDQAGQVYAIATTEQLVESRGAGRR